MFCFVHMTGRLPLQFLNIRKFLDTIFGQKRPACTSCTYTTLMKDVIPKRFVWSMELTTTLSITKHMKSKHGSRAVGGVATLFYVNK